MKQKIENVIYSIADPETRRKIRRYTIKCAWYCTLATLAVALLSGLLYLYCIIR